ncbi:PAS domain S-box protein [Thermodesulfobacteriota bacterium]
MTKRRRNKGKTITPEISQHKRSLNSGEPGTLMKEFELMMQSSTGLLVHFVSVVDGDGRVVTFDGSDSLRSIRDLVLGKTLHEFLPEETAASMLEQIRHTISSGKPSFHQLEAGTIGEHLPLHNFLYPLKSSDGTMQQVAVVSIDQEARHEVFDKLAESSERYRLLFDTANDAMLLAEIATGIIVDANIEAERLLGISRAKLIGSHVTEVNPTPGGRAGEVFEYIAEQASRGHKAVMSIRRNDGQRVVVEISSSTFEAGGKKLMLGIFRDITERQKAQEGLKESEAKYRALFEHVNEAIFIADVRTNKILDANPQAEQLLGRTRQEIIGLHQSKLHPPHRAAYYQDKFSSHVHKGRVLDLEADVIRKDRTVVPVVICANLIDLNGREVLHGLFKDISNEKIILDLRKEIAARQDIEKAKEILMDRHGISAEEAKRLLQKESRRRRMKVKKMAQAVISSEVIL